MVAGTVGGEVRQTSWEFLQLIFSFLPAAVFLQSPEDHGQTASWEGGETLFI